VLAFVEGAGKKVLASIEMYWHLIKELLKSVGKHRTATFLAAFSIW